MTEPNYSDPKYFWNRELSWVDFNDRVLEEARDRDNPLLERVKFLGITQSNLDEFFNVRVASLKKMESVGYEKPDASGMTPKQQLEGLSEKIHLQTDKQYTTLNRSLLPKLADYGIRILKPDELSTPQLAYIDDFFHNELAPVLTPMAFDVSRPFPFFANDSLNIAIQLIRPDETKKKNKEKSFAAVPVPGMFPRVIKLPSANNEFILLEDIIKYFVNELFIGSEIKETATFRVMRDMDMDVAEEDASDLMKEIQRQLKKRERGKALKLDYESSMSKYLRKTLIKHLHLTEADVYAVKGPLDLTFLSKLVKQVTGHKDLLYPPFTPYEPELFKDNNLFDLISQRDLFLNLPYDSFDPVVDFVREGAEDPQVLAIKMTLYRVSSQSPIITYLKKAADNGKQVTVLVELKARFDEKNNVHWAQELEKAGCHVIYGLVGLKTHCKLTLIVRREEDGIKRYMHMSTGNYNDKTAKGYTDMGLFTANVEMGIDASNIFNMLSGFSEPPYFHKLVIAPIALRQFIYDKIDAEIQNVKDGKRGFIQMKMNSLSDAGMISKLYEASHAGVEIHLLVRGICNLKVGIPGISDTITVHSIVGRFLEHSRIYYFWADGEEETYLSSADLMTRNISRRVELLFPILQPDIQHQVMRLYTLLWSDNVKTRVLQPDGSWDRVDRRGLVKLDAQEYQADHAKEIADYLITPTDETAKTTFENEHRFIPLMKPDDSLDESGDQK
ncbi:polyphosphate kinase [Lactobacillus selangorensis]|uniref:Polyphosphate kinase n=1 Tax=Lactobacillus selangorensis TaxID=81857 RepID=A0A0R2FS35_9LACO|nr:RNA degradosome polyphosphate kinase [Lactobacillus selangorensis]KRN27930.1 polyphosphate kinase [Lactobacillus selangorensis]KRN30599.1 polyphosphate kinase [Lactobacillus selangorensis]